MNSNSLKFSALVVLSVWMTGCVPLSYQTKPMVTGVVVDAATQSAVSGAVVSISEYRSGHRSGQSYDQKLESRQTKSRRNGTFEFSGQYSCYIYSPLGQTKGCLPLYEGGGLEVKHDGFETHVSHIPIGARKYHVVIPLRRVSE